MGRSKSYSAEELAFIESNHKRPRAEMHAEFVKRFDRPDVTLIAINSVCKRNKWYTGRKAKGGSHYPPEVVQFIKDNRTMPRKELLELVNTNFGLSMTYIALVNFCVRHGFSSDRKGYFGEHDGWKKGVQFVEQPIGYETKPDNRGRVYIKVAQPAKYRLKHHVIWEQHFGDIPENHVIVFRDGDGANFDPCNLVAVHRGVVGTLNRRYKPQKADPTLKPLLLTMAQIDHRILQKDNANA